MKERKHLEVINVLCKLSARPNSESQVVINACVAVYQEQMLRERERERERVLPHIIQPEIKVELGPDLQPRGPRPGDKMCRQ